MSRRVEYLNYLLLGEGNANELPQPVASEDFPLYEACINGGGNSKVGTEGFYRCQIHNTGNGNIDFIGSFLDLGEERVSSVKVKAVVTVRSAKVSKLGLRLFANNDENKEMLSGGYSNSGFDGLAVPTSGAELPLAGKYTLQATFNDVEAKTLFASRYLKAFISITKPAKEDICILDVHEFVVEIGNKTYNILDTVFNFQEGIYSDFKYIETENVVSNDAIARRKAKFFNKRIACLGDSLTNGYDPAKGDGTVLANPWRIQLRHKCGFTNVRNYGINGRMISKDKEDGTKSILNLVSNINEFPVAGIDVLTVFGGINDFSNRVPLGEFIEVKEEGVEYDVNTFYGALQALYEKLIQRFGQEFPILAINLLNANNSVLVESAKALGYASIEEGINAYREAIRVCAKHYGIVCLELQDVVGFDLFKEEDNTKYSGDLLHPNQLGHDLMANIIGEAIEKLV